MDTKTKHYNNKNASRDLPPKELVPFDQIDWYGFLPRMGIDPAFLTKRNGPCPMCGGKDRFRFDNTFATGNYWCQRCGPGNGWNLLKGCTGMSDAEIMDELKREHANCGGTLSVERPVARIKVEREMSEEEIAKNRAKLMAACKGTVEVTPDNAVGLYLRRRVPGSDLSKLSRHIRLNPSMKYYEAVQENVGGRVTDKFVSRGDFPVMVASVIDASKQAITIHRTYLAHNGYKADVAQAKKQMAGIRLLKGAAIRVCEVPHSRILGVCEGIETGWAVATAYNYEMNVWSLLNAGNLAVADIPAGMFDKVIIFADHDKIDPKHGYRPGEHYALLLQKKLQDQGIACEIKTPAIEGEDFADVWLAYYKHRIEASRQQAPQRAYPTHYQDTPCQDTNAIARHPARALPSPSAGTGRSNTFS